MEPEGSSLCSQETITDTYPETAESSPHLLDKFKKTGN